VEFATAFFCYRNCSDCAGQKERRRKKVLVGLAELDAVSGIGLIRVELGNAVGKGARIERWISNCIIVEWYSPSK